jgi:hypothetical protein
MIFSEILSGGISGIIKAGKELLQEFHVAPDKLMEFEQAAKQAERDMVLRLEEVAAKDRDSARQREMAVKDTTPRTLAFMIVGAFIAVAVFMIVHPYIWPDKELSANTIGMIGTVVGYLAAKAEQVASYYFGSSAGSEKKSDTIHNYLKDSK